MLMNMMIENSHGNNSIVTDKKLVMENSSNTHNNIVSSMTHDDDDNDGNLKSLIQRYFYSTIMTQDETYETVSDLVNAIHHHCTQEEEEEEKKRNYDDNVELVKDVLDTVIVLDETNRRARKVLNDLNGHLCKMNVSLLEQIKAKAPTQFGARVADFNDNLFYDMQEPDTLRKLLLSLSLLQNYNNNNNNNNNNTNTTNCGGDDDEMEIQKNIVEFERCMSETIGCSMTNMVYQGSFMKTEKTVPQPPHVDFQWDILDMWKEKLFIGFFPLTKEGMFLQVWNDNTCSTNEERNGRIVFIPYGRFLIVPSDTIHGGGFKVGNGGNLRFHMYIATDKNVLPQFPNNRYTEKNDCSKELGHRFKDSTKLHNLMGDFFDT